MKKVQLAVDAINTRIEILRKEVADLKGRRERLLASIGGSSQFGDQPLISELCCCSSFLFFFCSFPSLTTPSSALYLYIFFL